MNKTKLIKLDGSFQVTNGKLMVSDPCYDRGTWCQQVLDNVENGVWNAFVLLSDEGSWGVRNKELIIELDNCDDIYSDHIVDEYIGVDSGQAGFFNEELYPAAGENGEYGDHDTFYDRCCNATIKESYEYVQHEAELYNILSDDSLSLSERTLLVNEKKDAFRKKMMEQQFDPANARAGVVKEGAVSSSGFGDGSYEVRYKKNKNNKIVQASIDFIEDEEDYDDYEED